MKHYGKVLCTLVFSALFILSACSSQQRMDNADAANLDYHDKSLNTKGNGHVHGHSSSPDVIPSVDRAKKKTTNAAKSTTNGLGTNVYSLMGSSGLHDGGISSHLESRLSAAGIPGIKVFVLDDTIILARAKQEVTSTSYDEMQKKVLTNTSGMSGKGNLDGVDPAKQAPDDNLTKAKDLMNKAFDNQVQILTVTDPKAMTLIDGLKANLKAKTPSYTRLTSDLTALVKLTNEKK